MSPTWSAIGSMLERIPYYRIMMGWSDDGKIRRWDGMRWKRNEFYIKCEIFIMKTLK